MCAHVTGPLHNIDGPLTSCWQLAQHALAAVVYVWLSHASDADVLRVRVSVACRAPVRRILVLSFCHAQPADRAQWRCCRLGRGMHVLA